MGQIAEAFFLLLGAAFMLLAALGLVRMPDIFMRMHATTKATTFGLGLLLVAASIGLRDVYVTARSIAAIALFLSTLPVAAQIIARAAIHSGARLSERTVINELEDVAEPPGPPDEQGT